MTAPDRTEELVLEMLVRRGGGRPPGELLERTLVAIASTAQVRAVGHRPPESSRPSRRVLLLAAAAVVAVPAALVAVLAAGLVLVPARGGPAVADGSPVPASTPATAVATPTPEPSAQTPPTTGASPAPALALGSIAVVTLDGRNLRVRSVPTTDNDVSRKYVPLLPPGTRLLIVGGPVTADGMSWYEIQTDGELIDLFGWVSTGKDGESWIEPRPPRCPEHVDAGTLALLTRIDFLACYGDSRVRVQAKVADLWGPRDAGPSCGWVRVRDGTDCEADNRWLLFPDADVTLVTDQGNLHDVALALPPDMASKLLQVPPMTTSILTISMDAPEAAGCRVRSRVSGRDVIPIGRAITHCRLQFVIQEVVVDPDAAAGEVPVG